MSLQLTVTLALLATLAAPLPASASPWPTDDDHAQPCRPTIACTADFVPPGTLEVEAGYLFRRLHGGVDQHSSPLLLKLTVVDWLQLQLDTNGYTHADGPVPARFVDDIVVGAKLHLADQRRLRPSLAFSAALSAPVAAQQGFVETYDALFTGYITKDVGWAHFDLNVGLNFWRVERPVLTQTWIALATTVALPRRFGAMLEVYYFGDAAPIAPRDGGVLIAGTYSPTPWLVFDAGFDVGLVRDQRPLSAFAGVTVIPAILWR